MREFVALIVVCVYKLGTDLVVIDGLESQDYVESTAFIIL